jgi:CMP-N-acetylneuraminic acid synthetase
LLKVRAAGFIDSIIVNSDSEEMLKIGVAAGVEAQKRDAYYASSDCTNSEFHRHIGEVTKADDIFLAPVCSPFVTVATHITAIKYYYDEEFDSLTSVTEVKNHLWLGGHPLNYELDNVPNSQNLPDVVKLNYGVTIAKKEVMKDLGRVVGENPGFLKINEKESIDIDTPFDLAIARGILDA